MIHLWLHVETDVFRVKNENRSWWKSAACVNSFPQLDESVGSGPATGQTQKDGVTAVEGFLLELLWRPIFDSGPSSYKIRLAVHVAMDISRDSETQSHPTLRHTAACELLLILTLGSLLIESGATNSVLYSSERLHFR